MRLILLLLISGYAYAADTIMIDVCPGRAYGGFSKFSPIAKNAGEYLLTFDDGPVPGITDKIVDILLEQQVPAIFFMIGSRASRVPKFIDVAEKNGFIVGSHSFSHRNLALLSADEGEKDILAGMNAVNGQQAGHFFRFPEFKFTDELLRRVQRLGFVILSADISPADWRGDLPDQTFARFSKIITSVDRGIIVLHANQHNTVSLLPMIINEIRRRGGRFVGVGLNRECKL